MNPLEQLLSRRLRQAGEDLIGFVVSRNVDGSYRVRRRDTNDVIRAEADATDSYIAGTAVLMSDPSASKRALNTGYIILRRAPSALRNASGSLPIADSVSKSSPVVSIIVPNPVALVVGEVKTVTIHGAGFTLAPTFTNANVAHDSAPVITSTQITMQIVGAAVGSSGLVVGPRTFADIFTVTLEAVLWLSSSDSADPLLRFGAVTGLALTSVAQSRTVRTTFASLPGFVFVAASGTPTVFLKIDTSTLDVTTLTLHDGTVPDISGFVKTLVPILGDLFHNSSVQEYRLTAGGVNVAPHGAVGRNGALYDGTFLFVADTSAGRIRKITPSTMALVTGPVLGHNPRAICEDGTHLYCTVGATGTVLKILKADMSLVSTLTGLTSPEGILHSGGYLYVGEDTASANIRKIDAATMTLTASVASGRKTFAVTTDGVTLWTVENNKTDPHLKGFLLSDLSLVLDVVAILGATKNYNNIAYYA